jgi:hypothetical protein
LAVPLPSPRHCPSVPRLSISSGSSWCDDSLHSAASGIDCADSTGGGNKTQASYTTMLDNGLGETGEEIHVTPCCTSLPCHSTPTTAPLSRANGIPQQPNVLAILLLC